MGKTEKTKQLEAEIFNAIHKPSVFCCFEVTIGWDGKERVDMLSYDTDGIFRCFEIKVSIEDFHSKANKTFCGNYNYYVLTEELYEKVKNRIPAIIGVYVNGKCIKKAKKQEISLETVELLKNSMIRSLSRYSDKIILNEDTLTITQKNREISELTRLKNEYRRKYQELLKLYEPLGRRYNEKNGIIEFIKNKTKNN